MTTAAFHHLEIQNISLLKIVVLITYFNVIKNVCFLISFADNNNIILYIEAALGILRRFGDKEIKFKSRNKALLFVLSGCTAQEIYLICGLKWR